MRFIAALTVLALLPQEPPKPVERLVCAFYRAAWDGETGEGLSRIGGGDALLDHPESFKDFTYKSVAWHRQNLEEMGQAGIDVALCEFAGREEAVAPMIRAWEEAAKEFRRIPKVAPAVVLAKSAAAFLQAVPKNQLATVQDKPLVWLLPAKEPDPKAFDSLPAFKVGDAAWKPDLEVATGGAFDGPREGKALTLGPGFSDGNRMRARGDEGRWYERSWYVALKVKPLIVAIESWNRFDEGSTICPTKEHGRANVEKTKKYADHFRKGQEIGRPKGRYSDKPGVSYSLKFEPPNEGLKPVDSPGAPFDVVNLTGQSILISKSVAGQDMRYLAFEIDDSYALYERRDFEVQLQLLDKGPGSLTIEYDAAAPAKEGGERLHRAAEPWYYTNSGNWATVTFTLPEAAFANRQGGGGDFRLVRKGAGLSLRWIQVRGK
jgi:hypothetical protein